ncbi:translation initiation factor IF-2 [bacterium]|nr:translation initiation factor IF-2 [bacterium]
MAKNLNLITSPKIFLVFAFKLQEEIIMQEKIENKTENIQTRPPVVVVLGHVDHGKSSILQAIKDFKITERESGGITQHIGAYEVEHQGKKITFIDTPGHEAFSAMRSRGASVADIAVLVVAADEGVKPQTKEAIFHIKKTGIPLIVAINKIDKPGANPEKVKQQLVKEGILVESLGGKVPSVETSAVTGQGIDTLLELILLLGEIEELKGDREQPGEGVIIESYLDKKRGPTATLILRNGVLKLGDIIGTHSTLGKVKVLENFQGAPLKEAFPSQPCIVLGFENVPQVGEKVKVFPNIESAEKYLEKEKSIPQRPRVFMVESGKKVLNIILKVDVLGSLEPIEEVLRNLPQEKVILRILKGEVGEVSDSDVKLAKSSQAKIIGFRVGISPIAQKLAEREKIKILTYDVIYELTQGVRRLMEKMLEPEKVRVDLGKLKVLVIFKTSKNRQIVGARVVEGEIRKGVLIEVFRNGEKVGKGKVINLQKDKKDIEKGVRGEDCGILYEGDTKIAQGDILVPYKEEIRKREL